jgi:hypothetical protein
VLSTSKTTTTATPASTALRSMREHLIGALGRSQA